MRFINQSLFLFLLVFSFANSDANTSLKKRTQLYNQAVKHYKSKEYTQALKLFKQSLAIEESILGTHPDTLSGYHSIAIVYSKLYDPTHVIQYYEKALDLSHKLYQANHPRVALFYNELAYFNTQIGNFSKALKYNQKALALKESSLDQNSTKVQASIALSYNNIAELFRYQRRYNQAFSYYQKALKLRERVLGVEHNLTAQSYENMANFYSELGSYSKAYKYRNKAITIRQKTKDHLADSYHNLGRTYQKDGNGSKALEFYFKSIELRTQSKQDQDWKATAYSYIAQIYLQQNKIQKAFKFAKDALSIHQKILHPNSLYLATDYETVANIYYAKQGYKNSLQHNLKALTIRKKLLSDSLDVAQSYYYLSRDYAKLQDFNRSIEYAFRAFELFMHNQKEHFVILTSDQKPSYNQLYRAIDKFANLLTITQEYKKQIKSNSSTYRQLNQRIFNQWLKYKGRTSSKEDTIALLYSKIKKLKSNIEELKASKLYLSNLYKTYPNKNETTKIAKLEKSIKTTQKKINRLELELNKTDRIFQELLALQDIDYQDVVTLLQPHQLYIDFARIKEHYYIFTLSHDANITLKQVSTHDTHAIDNNITAFRAINHDLAKGQDDHNQWAQKYLSNIYTLLFKNYLNPIMKSKEFLIISPDGLLNFLPFDALYSGKRYLIETKHLSYIPSAKHLLYATKKEPKPNQTTQIIVFAHPDYYLNPQARTTRDTNQANQTKSSEFGNRLVDFKHYFADLNGSLEEMQTIKKLYPQAKIYQDGNATVENLFKVGSPDILHISTHGFFLEQVSNEYLMQSGLLFAGANLAKMIKDTQGIATAMTLSTLDLTTTNLVVLSACDTGLGKIENAEGVVGLPKAFIQAGAKNIIMSLWNVNDAKTATLMKKFYYYLHKESNQNYIKALRRAKLEMIQEHPYYWSGFILSGI
jgi:CHAT domain-containing protein/Tfp pilus assembly protein PilF